ncbi:CPA1 family monovalent cation:H+ antiporter [Pseudoclavibacter chungangensis]|nr:sodium:proton antiporter [Pseudoclavibacter chungangensis]NYJ68640.1 CPA1 family monovalent cation:H+ antiporter [Pseudoclavibacter chungangensis]
MDIAILVAVAAAVVIAVTARIAPKWHVAAPLVLVLVGIGVSFLPFVPEIEVEPDLILAVVLPPLLFGSAVSMPAMNFRREFTAISGLAVALVIVSSVLLGFVFHLIIPSLDLAWCIALGAILSPTDAVATTIARGVGISSRVTTILEGESLLNDATALVTLRTAIAAAAASFSLWEAIGQFAYSVAIALVIGFLAGKLGVYARRTAGDATIAAVLSFAVPFVASVPTDLLQGSGLVAAVVAGIVTGRAKDRASDPAQRLTAMTMWNAVTLVLEGAVFLVMGLEIRSLVTQHTDEADTIGSLAFIVVLAAFALVVMMLVRAAYMLPLIGAMGRNARRAQSMQPRMEAMESAIMDRDLHRAKQLKTPDPVAESETFHHRVKRTVGTLRHRLRRRDDGRTADPAALESRWQQLDRSVRRILSDIDYYTRQPLTMRDGIVMVGAGMRGAVTLAAAQTLPLTTPTARRSSSSRSRSPSCRSSSRAARSRRSSVGSSPPAPIPRTCADSVRPCRTRSPRSRSSLARERGTSAGSCAPSRRGATCSSTCRRAGTTT